MLTLDDVVGETVNMILYDFVGGYYTSEIFLKTNIGVFALYLLVVYTFIVGFQSYNHFRTYLLKMFLFHNLL